MKNLKAVAFIASVLFFAFVSHLVATMAHGDITSKIIAFKWLFLMALAGVVVSKGVGIYHREQSRSAKKERNTAHSHHLHRPDKTQVVHPVTVSDPVSDFHLNIPPLF